MAHDYPRIERDLRALAVNFSAGNLSARTLPERLECLAAYARTLLEAEQDILGAPGPYGANQAYAAAIERLRAVGVEPGEGEFTFSPCMGPEAR